MGGIWCSLSRPNSRRETGAIPADHLSGPWPGSRGWAPRDLSGLNLVNRRRDDVSKCIKRMGLLRSAGCPPPHTRHPARTQTHAGTGQARPGCAQGPGRDGAGIRSSYKTFGQTAFLVSFNDSVLKLSSPMRAFTFQGQNTYLDVWLYMLK